MPKDMTARRKRAHELNNLFMRESPSVGSKTREKADEKPCIRVWSSGPRTVAPVALMDPVATALAARLMTGTTRTSRAKRRSAHESGNSRTNREGVPRRWSDSPQLRPGGWSYSPHYLRGGWSDLPHPPRPTRLARPE
jgi:hypothetical protein